MKNENKPASERYIRRAACNCINGFCILCSKDDDDDNNVIGAGRATK
jgi:hypothetical protein